MSKNAAGSGRWKYQWALALGVLVSTAASAAPLSVVYDVPVLGRWSIGSDLNGFPTDSGNSWFVVDAQPWDKSFDRAPDKNGDGKINVLDGEYAIDEFLTIVNPLTEPAVLLNSWSETITSADQWIWAPGGTIKVTVNDGDSVFDQRTYNLLGTDTFISATFDADQINVANDFWTAFPLDAYFTLEIHKALMCNIAASEAGSCESTILVTENAPEPGTLLLLGAGLAGLGLRRRRNA